MPKPDSIIRLTDTLSLTEYKTSGSKGFWLFDSTQKINLSMQAVSERDAFVQALGYYQRQLSITKKKLEKLTKAVDGFIYELEKEANE
jgi:hypothetical protein